MHEYKHDLGGHDNGGHDHSDHLILKRSYTSYNQTACVTGHEGKLKIENDKLQTQLNLAIKKMMSKENVETQLV